MNSNWCQMLLAAIALSLLGGVQASEYAEFKKDVKQLVLEVKAALEAIDIYRTPRVLRVTDEELELSCRELEWAMTAILPKIYSYKPSFYDDPIQGAGIWGGTIFFPVYGMVLYGIYYDYKEDQRIFSTAERIELLRHLKAEQRCYE